MADIWNRMIRAAKLDVNLYEEVEADKNAMGQATTVVVLSSIAAGVGSIITKGGIGIILFGTIAALISWYVWAFLTYFIGTKLLPEPQTKADVGQLLRTLGFSASPGLIRVLGIIPGLSKPIFLIAGIWMLVAMVIAVRQALDYKSTGRAVGVCVIGWLIQLLVFGLLIYLLGGGTCPLSPRA
ncbi:MAG: YIP1 family protein [Candidatus Omnitrophota bacterium]